MILSKQKCCFLLTCVSKESLKLTFVFQIKRGCFSNKKYYSYKCWACAEVFEALLSSWKIYTLCAIWRQQIVDILMGRNYAPLIADYFIYYYEKGFMSDLQKSKRYDLIDMFNGTSRYLHDIFTIDNTVSQEPQCAMFRCVFTCSPIV